MLQGIEDHKWIGNFILEFWTISLAASNTFKMMPFGGVTIYKIILLKLDDNVKKLKCGYLHFYCEFDLHIWWMVSTHVLFETTKYELHTPSVDG